MCQLMPPTQAPPYPMGVGLGLFSTCQLMPPNPNPRPPYPMVLSKLLYRCIKITLQVNQNYPASLSNNIQFKITLQMIL
ncbi:hypothetical protein Hdeb2414_s0001g00026811 [Helianthus debilis subsp. tardiflorus]